MKIALIKGDGIGPDIVNSAKKVLSFLDFYPEYMDLFVGYERWKRNGEAISDNDLEDMKSCRAILKGPVTTPPRMREGFSSVTLRIRKGLDLYANVRPFKSLPVSPYKGVDLVIVRENTEGLYSGKERLDDGIAVTERVISESSSRKIIEYAFNLAERLDRDRITCIHKANIMKYTCGFFKEIFYDIAENYPGINSDDRLVDACAYELVKNPQIYDVLVTTNMFGDILSDEAAGLVGSLGLVGSYNVGEDYALFEPVHGSAPDIAGSGKANPIGMITAASYMLDYLKLEGGEKIRGAINMVLGERRKLTPDLGGKSTTEEITEAIISKI